MEKFAIEELSPDAPARLEGVHLHVGLVAQGDLAIHCVIGLADAEHPNACGAQFGGQGVFAACHCVLLAHWMRVMVARSPAAVMGGTIGMESPTAMTLGLRPVSSLSVRPCSSLSESRVKYPHLPSFSP